MRTLENKTALVTGAARNVGRGIALSLATEGAHVILVDRDGEALGKASRSMEERGLSVKPVIADIASEAEMERVFLDLDRERGRIDILVNNAVIHANKGERGPFLKVTLEGWRAFTARNMDSMFFVTQMAAVRMCAQRSGSIIGISSNGAAAAHRQMIAYDAVKGALESFTRAVAVDLAPWGVRVNAIRPCAISDGTVTPEKAALYARLGDMIPMGRIAHPSDAGWVAVFLADDRASFITGQVITVDGGMLEQSRPPQLELAPVAMPEGRNV